MNILVIDVGTSSMRGVLIEQMGKQITYSQSFYQVKFFPDGRAEQEPEDWKNALYEILRKSMEEAKKNCHNINAISITAQRSSVIPIDRHGNTLMDAIMWQDKRTQEICYQLEQKNEVIFTKCGAKVNTVFSGSKMKWIKDNRPDIYEKSEKLVTVADYLVYLLTGNCCTDHTYASRTLLMNIRKQQWDTELLELFGIEKEKLCDLIMPGSVCGTTTAEIEQRTQLPMGVPVISAGGDQQCSAIGQGVIKSGVLAITAGTGGFLVTSINEVPQNLQMDVICNCSAQKDRYVLEMSTLTCCAAFDWFRREFYKDVSYDKIDQEILLSPIGANGCICLPFFQGRTAPDWNMQAKGTFHNVSLHTRRCDMLRSLIEGICFEFKKNLEVLEQYTEIESIRVNGGLSNSEAFMQILCDVIGKKIIRQGNADAAVKGAWMVASVTLGINKNIEEAYQVVKEKEIQKTYIPDMKNHEQYNKKCKDMNKLYQNIYLREEQSNV